MNLTDLTKKPFPAIYHRLISPISIVFFGLVISQYFLGNQKGCDLVILVVVFPFPSINIYFYAVYRQLSRVVFLTVPDFPVWPSPCAFLDLWGELH